MKCKFNSRYKQNAVAIEAVKIKIFDTTHPDSLFIQISRRIGQEKKKRKKIKINQKTTGVINRGRMPVLIDLLITFSNVGYPTQTRRTESSVLYKRLEIEIRNRCHIYILCGVGRRRCLVVNQSQRNKSAFKLSIHFLNVNLLNRFLTLC